MCSHGADGSRNKTNNAPCASVGLPSSSWKPGGRKPARADRTISHSKMNVRTDEEKDCCRHAGRLRAIAQDLFGSSLLLAGPTQYRAT